MPELSYKDRAAIHQLRDEIWRVVRSYNYTPAVSLTALCHVVGMLIGKTRRNDAQAAVNMAEVANNMIPMYANAYTREANPLVD